MSGCDLLLEALDLVVAELDDVAAVDAHEVVVVLVGVGCFVSGGAVSEAARLCEAALDQELQRPIDGGLPDVRMLSANRGVELVDVRVAAVREEGLGNGPALSRDAKPGPREVLGELRFPRGRGIIGHRSHVLSRTMKPQTGCIAEAMNLRRRQGWALGGAIALMAGCGSAAPTTPTEVTRAQIRALAAGEEAEAARWLAPEALARAPQWPGTEALPSAESVHEAERIARWTGGRDLELVRGADGWMLRRGVLSLFRADTAEAAAAAFGRAIDAGDASLVHELLPAETKRRVGVSELARVMDGRRDAWKALGQSLANGAVAWSAREPTRAEATVTLRGGVTRVVLVQESGGWKVFDVAPWSEYIDR